MKVACGVMAALLLWLAPLSASAVVFEGTDLPDRLSLGGAALALNGYGARRTPVAPAPLSVVALYTTRPARSLDAVMASLPAVVLVQHRESRTQADQIQIYRYFFTENCRSPCRMPWPAISQFGRLLSANVPGQVDAFVIRPDGVEVSTDGVAKGRVGDPAFGLLLLKVWLGDYAQTVPLRQALLGGPPS